MTLYNEFDQFAAAWLRELVADNLITQGTVDARDIRDIIPTELVGHRQVHLFAGIGVWSLALRLAGVPDDAPVWTASCPCQPFSAAGRRGGTADERHLWPAAFHLIRHCRPPIVMGEQVASPDGLAWLDVVLADLEAEGYTCRAVDLCAAGVGAPHIRQRLYWLAHAELQRAGSGEPGVKGHPRLGRDRPAIDGEPGGMADGHHGRCDRESATRLCRRRDGSSGDEQAEGEAYGSQRNDVDRRCEPERLGHSLGPRLEGHAWHGDGGDEPGRDGSLEGRPVAQAGDAGRMADAGNRQLPKSVGRAQGRNGDGSDRRDDPASAGRPGPTNGLWRDPDWLLCRDAKWRPVEPSHVVVADDRAVLHALGGGSGEGPEVSQGQGEVTKGGGLNGMQTMREGIGSQDIPVREDRAQVVGRETEVLRQEVHGRASRGAHQGRVSEELQEAVGQDREVGMRDVREDHGETACPPRRHGPDEQLFRKPPDTVLLMPSSLAFAQLRGQRKTAEAMLALRAAMLEEGTLLDPLESPEEAWECLGPRSRARIAGLADRLNMIVVRPHPLAHSRDFNNRLGALRGAGNAINVAQAAAFIKANGDVIAGLESNLKETT